MIARKTKLRLFFLIIVILCGFLFFGCEHHYLPKVTIQTGLGQIVVEVDTAKAPVTAGNFLNLAEGHVFDGASFYRVARPDNQPLNQVKIEVIQGGLFEDSLVLKYPAIIHETTRETGIRHLDGTISMARDKPGSASTEFFICIGDQPSLDYGGARNPDGQGFSAFGKVVEGMDVARLIQQKPDTSQYLTDPIKIDRIKVEK